MKKSDVATRVTPPGPSRPEDGAQVRSPDTAGAAVTLGSAALAALAITALFASRREFWLDEYYTALLANMSFGDMAGYVTGDVHPPLYYLVIGVWRRIFGDSQAALRAFSTVMHLLGAGVFFLLAREVLGRTRLAVIGTVLFLLSPALLFHAAEARMYSMSVLLITTATLLMWRQRSGQGGMRGAIALGVICALSFHTQYLTLFVAAALFLFWGVSLLRSSARRQPFFAAGAAFGALTLPWVPVVLRQMSGKQQLKDALRDSWSDPAALSFAPEYMPPIDGIPNLGRELATNFGSLAGVFPAASGLVTLLLAVPIAVILALAVLRTVRGDARGLLVALVCAAGALGCVTMTVMNRRYLLWLVPLIVLLLCLGLLEARNRYGRAVHAVLAATLLLLTTAGAVRMARSEGYERILPIVDLVGTRGQPGDLVVFNVLYAQAPFDYQARFAGIDPERRGFPETLYDWWERQGNRGWGSPVILRSDLESFLDRIEDESRTRVWLVQFEAWRYDPHGLLLAGFESRGWAAARCEPPEAHLYALYLLTRQGSAAACGDETGAEAQGG